MQPYFESQLLSELQQRVTIHQCSDYQLHWKTLRCFFQFQLLLEDKARVLLAPILGTRHI